MVVPVGIEKHTIKVFTSRDHGREEALRQLRYGIEEEGVPCEVEEDEDQFISAVELAWKACNKSRLGVGLGLDHDTLVLHFNKLKEDRPLFQISARSPEEEIRSIGANAARLIKKLPFKQISEDR